MMTDNAATAELDASESAIQSPASSSHAAGAPSKQKQGHRRRSKSSRQLIKVQRTNRNLKIGMAVLIMSLTAVIVVGKQVQSKLDQRSTQQEQRIDALRLQLSESETLSRQLLSDMNALVESRLPGLRPLEFDTIVQISEQYVKNVIFALSKDGNKTSYEYRFVLFNPKITPVFPRMKLLLFNDRGLQVGGSDVTLTGEASEGRVRSLGPGEIRSYNGSTEVTSNSKPTYFMLDISTK